MVVHLLIDGYNLLHATDRERDQLIDELHQYQHLKEVEITVVFDGSDRTALYPQRDKMGAIEIVFTVGDMTADDWIARECQHHPGTYLVVSSDSEVAHEAEMNGCLCISSQEFARKLEQALTPSTLELYGEEKDDSGPLYPKISTKKKGVAKRLPKGERKKKLRLKHL